MFKYLWPGSVYIYPFIQSLYLLLTSLGIYQKSNWEYIEIETYKLSTQQRIDYYYTRVAMGNNSIKFKFKNFAIFMLNISVAVQFAQTICFIKCNFYRVHCATN